MLRFDCSLKLPEEGAMVHKSADRTQLWLKWSGWITAAWVCSLVVKDTPMIARFGYPAWFLVELEINGLAAILEFVIAAAVAGVITVIVVFAKRDVSAVWGGSTPFHIGLAWALGVGVVLGVVMIGGTHHG